MIELLCIITNAKYDKKIKAIYKKFNLPLNLATYGNGTASSSLLEYFGLEEVKKYIYFSLIKKDMSSKVLNKINNDIKLDTPGNGICFTIPLSSSTKYISDKLTSNVNKEVTMEKDNEEKIINNKNYELIVSIVSEGFAENVMATAKKAGANGGTLIRGRSLVKGDTKRQFLGFSIEPEKDIVINVIKKDIKNTVMEAIVKENGLKTKGSGIVFSLPISEAIGLYE